MPENTAHRKLRDHLGMAARSCVRLCEVIIFGSRAKGNFRRGSDIDIALKGEHISFELVAGLQTRFNQEMPVPHHVDLVHYESISNQDLIDHIDRVGISIVNSSTG
jgi:predicted nucleotidyltransferase